MSKKLAQAFSDLQVCLFKYLKKGLSKKIPPGIFEICQYAFLNISKIV